MGLNDLTLEKLISEINSYKDKMRAIYEDYGRASQELQDRINVLGYNLNEHLKETKDQIASTPQRLLTLETKYVAGEVNDGEYRQQREEFKGLLDRNLRSIEEIRAMISTLSHIEARPLTPAEFKQTPKAPQNLGWGPTTPVAAPVFAQPQQNTPVIAPQAALRFGSETPTTAPATPSYIASPQPTSQPTPAATTSNPLPANAPETTSSLSEAPVAPTLLDTPVDNQEQSITEAVSTIAAPEAVSDSHTDETLTLTDDATQSVPTVDIVETTGADDALMVKVVDDVPIADASAQIATSDPAGLQPALGAAETSTGIPSAAPDLATVSLTPPTQFYKVVCPKCGADVPKPAKVWELKGGKSKKNVLIGLFQCQDCRVKFREALTREII